MWHNQYWKACFGLVPPRLLIEMALPPKWKSMRWRVGMAVMQSLVAKSHEQSHCRLQQRHFCRHLYKEGRIVDRCLPKHESVPLVQQQHWWAVMAAAAQCTVQQERRQL
jgi:hypothetical protein